MLTDLQRFLWRNPSWWTLGLSLLAWLAVLIQAIHPGSNAIGDHEMHVAMPLGKMLVHWGFMIAAMMFPSVLGSVTSLADRSLWQRRTLAIFEFLLAYLTVWMVFGLFVSLIPWHYLAVGLPQNAPVTLALLLSAAWHISPWRGKASRRCHRTIPLAPRGWRADYDCFRFGCLIASSCLATCWALMLVCVISGHSFVVLVSAAGLTLWERSRNHKQRSRFMASATAALALLYAAA